MFLTLTLATVLAGDPATMNADGIVPIARPDQVRACVQALGLSDESMGTLSLVIEDYESSMDAAHSLLLESVAGARSQLDEAFAGRRRFKPDALRALREQIVGAPRMAWPMADAGLDDLVETMALFSALPDQQVTDATNAFRRDVLQRSVMIDGSVVAAGLRLNVEHLAAEAMDTELQGIDAAQLAQALTSYRRAMDAAVPAWFAARRSRLVDDSLANITGDRAKRVTLMKEAAARWRAQDTLHGQAVDMVAGFAESVGGPAAKSAWLLRAQQARFPALYNDRRLEATRDWIAKNGSATQAHDVQLAYAAWLVAVRPVADTMSALMRQGLEKGGDVQHDAVAWLDETKDIRRSWLQASGDRQVRLETARATMERQLSDGQRAAVRRSMLDQPRR